jgi:uncharacterized protein (TIGR03000 family)
LGAIFLFQAVGPGKAGWPPPGIPSGVMPWELHKYKGYSEPRKPGKPPPKQVTHTPQKYTLHASVLARKNANEDPNTAVIVGHLPENALIWFEDQPTSQRGTLRQWVSPRLDPSLSYRYTVRVQWPENDEWVSQMHSFPVKAGDVHCIDIIPKDAETVEKEIATSLAKLSPEDRKLAEAQRFCAVQDGIRLGSMGVPTKVMVQGEAVFLCCQACDDGVRKNPDEALKKARANKGKNVGAPPE